MPKVHEFPAISSLHPETQLYTQRRSNSETPTNYRFSVEELAAYFFAQFNMVQVMGAYSSDSDASSNGIAIGEIYEVTMDNVYGLPEGTLKTRRE